MLVLPEACRRPGPPASSAREIENDAAAARPPRLGPDGSTVELDDRPCDREPEAGAAWSRSARGVQPVEAVEDALDVTGGHTGAFVADLDPDAAGHGRTAHPDLRARRAVPDGVGEEIGQDLMDPLWIADPGQPVVHVGDDPYPGVDRANLGRGGLDRLRDQEVLPVNPDRTRFELGQLQQLVDQPAQPLDALEHGGDGFLIERLDTIGEVLQPGPQRGDRRTELMTDVRHQ